MQIKAQTPVNVPLLSVFLKDLMCFAERHKLFLQLQNYKSSGLPGSKQPCEAGAGRGKNLLLKCSKNARGC